MNIQFAKLKRVAIFLTGISTAPIPAMAHADWSIVGLGTLVGESYAYGVSGINDSGQVIGYSDTGGEIHAFITGPNGIGMTDLGNLGGAETFAYGINNSGQVVGVSNTGSGNHAFITGPNGIGMTDLGTLKSGVWSWSEAHGVNDAGEVVGIDNLYAFITGPNGIGMTDLGISGGSSSIALGINNSGQVVGDSDNNARYLWHAFITGPNGIGMTDLGDLGGNFSHASDINDSGQVVGMSSTGSGSHAFITGPNGMGMTDLGTLGGNYSEAYGINNAGEVVGVAAIATGEKHAFIFSHGEMIDLSLLTPVVAAGWTDLSPTSINNNGQIAGYGQHHGNKEVFLLSFTTAVPEPETYLMLLSGLGLIGYVALRRKETAI